MGVVIMAVDVVTISHGYPLELATLYVYCDRCGSFNVREYLHPRKPLIFAADLTLLALWMLRLAGYPLNWAGLLLGTLFCILISKFFWGDQDYRCRKCGSVTTAAYNTLNYPSEVHILDVPEQQVQKRYLQYWPDMYDLDEALKAPEVPPQRAALGPAILAWLWEALKVILTVPLIILFFTLYPFLLLVYAIWTEAVAGTLKRIKTHGGRSTHC